MPNRIKDLRMDKDMNQQALADILHCNQRTVSCYETGARDIPTDVLKTLADYFDTSTDYLLGLTDVKKPYPRKPKN